MGHHPASSNICGINKVAKALNISVLPKLTNLFNTYLINTCFKCVRLSRNPSALQLSSCPPSKSLCTMLFRASVNIKTGKVFINIIYGRFDKSLKNAVVGATLGVVVNGCATNNEFLDNHEFTSTKGEHIYVSIGRPRHWTLNDAHYLLAGVHDRARALTIAQPSVRNLNPNAFNSSRIKQIESVFDLAVRYDELVGLQNKTNLELLKSQQVKATEAQQSLSGYTSQRDDLRDEKVKLAKEKAVLDARVRGVQNKISYQTSELSRLEDLKTEAKKEDPVNKEYIEDLDKQIETIKATRNALNQELDEKVNQQTLKAGEIAAIDERLSHLDTSITETSSAATSNQQPQFSTVQVPDIGKTKTGESTLRSNLAADMISAIRSQQEGGEGLVPSLNVSDSLANYIDAENELLARQLTLLRNEIGDDKQVVFLELPHSIHATSERSAGKLVQIQWEVVSYCTGNPVDEYWKNLASATKHTKLEEREQDKLKKEILNSKSFVDRACRPSKGEVLEVADNDESAPVAWDLIPKTNAYNIADYRTDDTEINLAFIFSRIIGLGADARYSRRKQLFEQFATQDVFATAYGQGESDFGWVLSPKPGANHVSSGTKTTYAAITVPHEASVLTLKQSYRVLNSGQLIEIDKKLQANVRTISIPIGQRDSFFIDEIDYGEVEKGNPATMIIKGSGFSPFQLDVLVDGEPLSLFNGVGPNSRSLVSTKPSSKPIGHFEVTNSRTIVVNFRMPDMYVGTPEITLVTPARSLTLNYLPLNLGVNNEKKISLYHQAKQRPIFQDSLSIERVSLAAVGSDQYQLSINGTGFSDNVKLDILNEKGEEASIKDKNQNMRMNVESSKHITVVVKKSKKWTIRARKQLAYMEVVTPPVTVSQPKKPSNRLDVTAVTVSRILPVGEDSYKLHLNISGTNFRENIKVEEMLSNSNVEKPILLSSKELFLVVTTQEPEILLQFSLEKYKIKRFVAVPQIPTITKITNTKMSAPKGSDKGGYVVVIKGKNLSSVKRVTFGDNAGKIVAKGDSVLSVVCPSGKGTVPVILQSDGIVGGTYVTNSNDFATGTGPVFEYVASKK